MNHHVGRQAHGKITGKTIQYHTSVLEAEHELETVLLGVRVPVRPVPVASVVGLVFNFPRGDAEGNRLVRLSSNLSQEPLASGVQEKCRSVR